MFAKDDDVTTSEDEVEAVAYSSSDSDEDTISFFTGRTRNEIEQYLLKNGTLVHFKSSRPQQLYIDENKPESYADLSIVGEYALKCAGESGNALYFYTHPSKEYHFYRAKVIEKNGKISLEFRFVRAKTLTGTYHDLAVQQPFLLEDNYGDCKIENFDGQPFQLDNCSNLFSNIESTAFFCHRGLVYLLERSNDDEKTNIVNAGHVVIINLEKRYSLHKILPFFGQWGPAYSVYAQDDSLIYVKCRKSVMVIGPAHEFFFVELDSRRHEYIVGIQNDVVITQTEDGLAYTNIGEKHEEFCQQLSDRNEREITSNRAEIARLHAEKSCLKLQIERSEETQSKLERDNVKLRFQFGQVPRLDSRISSVKSPLDDSADNQYTSKFSSEFNVCKILGVGGFGIVFQAENNLDEWKYAVKRITVSPDEQKVKKTLGEVRAMAQLDHPGIVRYNGTWLERPPHGWQSVADDKLLEAKSWQRYDSDVMNYQPDSVFIYIQMQLCASSLYDWLADNRDSSARLASRMKSWFRQVVSAVQYIHEKGMIHRDIKPRNILFVDDDRLKICDLGIVTARKIDERGQEFSTLRTDIGTGLYMSPEQRSPIPIYSSKTDVFALGLIFAEMMLVMNEDDRTKIFDGYRNGKQQVFDDEETTNFVAWIADVTSKKRPDCGEILRRPFLV